jgi:hypothetical protein
LGGSMQERAGEAVWCSYVPSRSPNPAPSALGRDLGRDLGTHSRLCHTVACSSDACRDAHHSYHRPGGLTQVLIARGTQVLTWSNYLLRPRGLCIRTEHSMAGMHIERNEPLSTPFRWERQLIEQRPASALHCARRNVCQAEMGPFRHGVVGWCLVQPWKAAGQGRWCTQPRGAEQ